MVWCDNAGTVLLQNIHAENKFFILYWWLQMWSWIMWYMYSNWGFHWINISFHFLLDVACIYGNFIHRYIQVIRSYNTEKLRLLYFGTHILNRLGSSQFGTKMVPKWNHTSTKMKINANNPLKTLYLSPGIHHRTWGTGTGTVNRNRGNIIVTRT